MYLSKVCKGNEIAHMYGDFSGGSKMIGSSRACLIDRVNKK